MRLRYVVESCGASPGGRCSKEGWRIFVGGDVAKCWRQPLAWTLASGDLWQILTERYGSLGASKFFTSRKFGKTEVFGSSIRQFDLKALVISYPVTAFKADVNGLSSFSSRSSASGSISSTSFSWHVTLIGPNLADLAQQDPQWSLGTMRLSHKENSQNHHWQIQKKKVKIKNDPHKLILVNFVWTLVKPWKSSKKRFWNRRLGLWASRILTSSQISAGWHAVGKAKEMPDISWKARKTPFASDLNSSRGHLNGYGSRQNSKSSRYQVESERTSSSKIVRHRLLFFRFLLFPGCIPCCNQKFQVQVRKTHLSRIHPFGISWMPPPLPVSFHPHHPHCLRLKVIQDIEMT